jgi:hypothetical protein
MWFFEQSRRDHQNPRTAVRAKAEYRAEQRMRRIASRQWFGYSNMRPQAVTTPTHTTTGSPQWGSNSVDPYRWSGVGQTSVVVLPGVTGALGLR